MKALFLDLDGTVRTTKGDKPCPNYPHEQEVMPGREEVIRQHKSKGYKILAVTNQGGIGLGFITEKENLDLNNSIMVGDRDSDKQAARNAGVKFYWAKEFFND